MACGPDWNVLISTAVGVYDYVGHISQGIHMLFSLILSNLLVLGQVPSFAFAALVVSLL